MIRVIVNRYLFPYGSIRRYWLSVLREAVPRPVRLSREVDTWWDYRSFRRTTRSLFPSTVVPRRAKGPALIVSLSDSVYSAKLEGMLAIALQLQGLQSMALVRRNAFWGKRYLQLFGINQFMFLEDYVLTDAERATSDEAVNEFMSRPLRFADIKDWVFEGGRVGQYALSTVARRLHRGMPDLRDQETIRLLREQLQHSIEGVFKAKRIFEKFTPSVCLFNEINYSDYGPMYAVAFQRGLNIIQFVHALRDRALIFKRSVPETLRMHPNSVSRNSLEKLAHYPWLPTHERMLRVEFADRYGGRWFLSRREQRAKRMKTREEISRQLELDPKKKVAVIYSHILWDANLFYGDDLFDDNEHWFVETVRAACENPNVNWIVKLHPAIMWKREWDNDRGELNEVAALREKVGDIPSHVKVLFPDTDINTYSLFGIGDYGVTIRGTVGMELPCLGIPVLTAGTGRYSGLGFTIDSTSRQQYLSRLRDIHHISPLTPAQVELAKKHALAVFCLRPWVMETFENRFSESVKGFHPLNPNLFLVAKTQEDFAKSGDLENFARWAVDGRSPDYMEPWPIGGAEDANLPGINAEEKIPTARLDA
jgi:Capsule polysaccharide biosynthesis protein